LKTPLGIDDLVKGLLPLISTVGGGEGKRSFFPFLDVTLVEEGTSSNPGGGGGEKYLCGEGHLRKSTQRLEKEIISDNKPLRGGNLLLPHLNVQVQDDSK
jgi:hypothetical protein